MITTWPDEHRNVQSREVFRPALPSRYFKMFNRVDVHNMRRQSELNVEGKWGTHDPYFRLFCTIIGMTVVDTMLAVKCESHPRHPVRIKTTQQFAEDLCEEMLVNTIDGKEYDTCISRDCVHNPDTDDTGTTESGDHVMVSYGYKSDFSEGAWN